MHLRDIGDRAAFPIRILSGNVSPETMTCVQRIEDVPVLPAFLSDHSDPMFLHPIITTFTLHMVASSSWGIDEKAESLKRVCG